MSMLQEYLEKNKVKARLIDKPRTRHTLDAARVLGAEPERMIKALVCLTEDKKPVLAMVNGNSRLDPKKLAKLIGTPRVILVDAGTAEKLSGYPPGGTPPVGLKTEMTVVLDIKLSEFPTIYGGGGDQTKVIEISPQEIIRHTKAVIGDIAGG